MQFYTEQTRYSYQSSQGCSLSQNRSYDGPYAAYLPAFTLSCDSSPPLLVNMRECQLQGLPFVFGISDLAKKSIQDNPGSLNNYAYLSLGQANSVSFNQSFSFIQGYRYRSCGTTESAGSTSSAGPFKIGTPFSGAPGYQQKPPVGLFMLPPSITRKMSGPIARKTLARSAAKVVPVVGFLATVYDAARMAQAVLNDVPTPNNLQTPASPSGSKMLMLASEPTEQIKPENNNNHNRVMPGVTFIDSNIVTNNLYQITQIDWDSPETSETNDWLIKAIARAALAVLEAFGREFAGAMDELGAIISGTITAAQKVAGEIISDLAKEILGQLSDNGEDGLPDEPGALDYEALASAIASGVSEALASYNPPAPPPSETIVGITSALEAKLDQYFTIPDTDAGLAETISTNGIIFNPGPMP